MNLQRSWLIHEELDTGKVQSMAMKINVRNLVILMMTLKTYVISPGLSQVENCKEVTA